VRGAQQQAPDEELWRLGRTTLCAFPRAAIQFGAFYLWATANGPLNLLAVPPARLALCAVLGAAGQARRCRAT
jgi:hypothetical protein